MYGPGDQAESATDPVSVPWLKAIFLQYRQIEFLICIGKIYWMNDHNSIILKTTLLLT